MLKKDLIAAVRSGFSAVPHPGREYEDIIRVSHGYDDEGVYDHFVGSSQFDHSVSQLRYHSVALVRFTNSALRYWLPAFLIAELEDPEEADILDMSIYGCLTEYGRLKEFQIKEIKLLEQFAEYMHAAGEEDSGGNNWGDAYKVLRRLRLKA